MKIIKNNNVSRLLEGDRIMLSEAYYHNMINGVYSGIRAKSAPTDLEFDKEENLVTRIYSKR